jgi:hypothetical protein
VLNHLGRNLYRSFVTVLGEAISNAWDADAENVWIYVNKKADSFVIKDDGIGMSESDFQNKFLKIGYSKRRSGDYASSKSRPYIGRKGIGKLALLSCARQVAVLTKTEGGEYVGGVIDNSGLEKAIVEDLTPQQYKLGGCVVEDFAPFTDDHDVGTIIKFVGIKDGIRNTLDYLKKTVALYFKFSLIDESFNIYINDELITADHLSDLAQKTEFCWKVNDLVDPFVDEQLTKLKEPAKQLNVSGAITGFIATVQKPRDLKIITTDERISVDLFVNGRLRERDILKHMPTARLVENYSYGQIHFNELDDDLDRFTSSREGIVSDDPKFRGLLEILKGKVIGVILDNWDELRRKHRKPGDPDSKKISPRERKSQELYFVVSDEYVPPDESAEKDTVDRWVLELGDDAAFNFASYADCFISENLVRKYIDEKKVKLSKEATDEVKQRVKNEKQHKGKGNISITIRKNAEDLSYLSMDHLANLVDKRDPAKEACLRRDAFEYKPIRDALMHTALLTDEAKRKLSSVYDNIKARVKRLLSTGKVDP